MSTLTIINDASFIDCFDGGVVFARPSSLSLVVQRDGMPDETRPIGQYPLFVRCVKLPDGSVWTVHKNGDDGNCIVTYDAEPSHYIDLGPTFGQQVCAIAYSSLGFVLVAFTNYPSTWVEVWIDALTHEVRTPSVHPIQIPGQETTSQGMLSWNPYDAPRWTDEFRVTTIDGVTMMLAVTADNGIETLTVGQPVTGPEQVAGVHSDGLLDMPTSLFKNMPCRRWPEVCAQADGQWRVVTALDKDQAAAWVGHTSELPPYDPVTPVHIWPIHALTHSVSIVPFVQAPPAPNTYGAVGIRMVPK